MSAPRPAEPVSGPAEGRSTALPRARVRPPRGWLNDPHGPVRWGGRWHVFFQHNPDSAAHGRICWGHASSADLVSWTDEPVALRPTPGGIDAFGCWTGCLVVDGDTAVIAYTAVADDPVDATIALATSSDRDLATWTTGDRSVAVAPPGSSLTAFRDPFVVEVDGRRLAVVGAGLADGTGAVLLYDADDLQDWRYLGVLLDVRDPVAAEVARGDVWECPQLFRVDGHWVLVLSLVDEPHRGRVVHLTGDLVPDGGAVGKGDSWRMVPVTGGLVDHGHDLYAPAVLAAATPGTLGDDRTLLWGWVAEDRPQADSDAAGWSGALSVVRELALDDAGRLLSRPVAELAERLGEPEVAELSAGDSVTLPVGPVDVLVEGDAPVVLRLPGDVRLRIGDDDVALERVPAEPDRAAWPTRGVRTGSGPWSVRLVVDASVLEIFVTDGPCFTERVYAGDDVSVLEGRARVTVRRVDLD